MAQAGRWWSRSRGLPAAAYDAWRTSLRTAPERPTRILAWAHTDEGLVVGSPAALSWSAADSTWTHVGWHEVERGGWNAETRKLSWALYGGRRGSVVLDEPGRLPELFRERIAASILVEKFVAVTAERGITISARLNLAASGQQIEWHTSLGRGLTWRTEGVQAIADQALAEMRSEYDIGRLG